MLSASVPLYASRKQQRAGQQQAAGQPGGFLFLLGVAGEERVAGELLDFPDVVAEEEVGEFVPGEGLPVGGCTTVSPQAGCAAGLVAAQR